MFLDFVQRSSSIPSRSFQGEGLSAASGMLADIFGVIFGVLTLPFIDYSKLPSTPTVDQVFILDPLVATGGTACAALAMIVDWGISGTNVVRYHGMIQFSAFIAYTVKNIKLLCVLASQEGLNHVQAEYPDLEVSRIQ